MRKNYGIAFDVDRASQVMHEMGLNFSRLAEKCGWDRHMVAELFKKGRCRLSAAGTSAYSVSRATLTMRSRV
jgi:hypothetical protein